MVALDVTDTSKALVVVGGYVVFAGLVSYFFKERLFMSESLLALFCGVAFGPIAANLFNPQDWVTPSTGSISLNPELNYLTFQIARIIIAIQVLFTGISLPKAYLKREWLSLTTLLGPVLLAAWFSTSLLIWGLIPGLSFVECLIIAACVTPTDPVLANSICKGRFAEENVPLHVRNILLAESGANDGFGFPFLYMGLYLILIKVPSHPRHSIGGAIGEWFYNVILYQILLSVVLGVFIGYVARKILRYAEEKNLIDHESFLSFGVGLTFFSLGCVGILGSDDILCCFVVGNSFTWDDWFRVQTEDHAFQDVIDQLLASAIFLYIGAIMPWSEFGNYASITPWRLVILGITVMLLRRLPWVVAMVHWIPALPTWREAAFAGFFGPIGVGAVYYVQVALEKIPDDGTRDHLRQVITPVVYFLILTSVIVHGITIPINRGFKHAQTLTMSRSQTGTANEPNNVSRLPPPQERQGTPSDSTNMEQAVRFTLDDDRNNSSLASSPNLRRQTSREDHADRMTGADREGESIWREGSHVVVESDNGESVRVLSEEQWQTERMERGRAGQD
ncbi:sodium/hydrogen antiporter, partial [Tremellales sp. Uapishka_1]